MCRLSIVKGGGGQQKFQAEGTLRTKAEKHRTPLEKWNQSSMAKVLNALGEKVGENVGKVYWHLYTSLPPTRGFTLLSLQGLNS